jgi:hypothetical protein
LVVALVWVGGVLVLCVVCCSTSSPACHTLSHRSTAALKSRLATCIRQPRDSPPAPPSLPSRDYGVLVSFKFAVASVLCLCALHCLCSGSSFCVIHPRLPKAPHLPADIDADFTALEMPPPPSPESGTGAAALCSSRTRKGSAYGPRNAKRRKDG